MTTPDASNPDVVDLKLTQDSNYLWDINFADNGDFELTDGLDTSFSTTFFTDRRAATSEVPTPEQRRGWWGNLVSDVPNLELGSKLWLLDQAVNSTITLANAIKYAQEAYQWLIDFNYADNVEVSGEQSQSSLSLTIRIVKDKNVIEEKVYDLWVNTVKIANG